jgi:hypothetical protein
MASVPLAKMACVRWQGARSAVLALQRKLLTQGFHQEGEMVARDVALLAQPVSNQMN